MKLEDPQIRLTVTNGISTSKMRSTVLKVTDNAPPSTVIEDARNGHLSH